MKKLATIFLVTCLLLPLCKGKAQEVISSAGANGTSTSVQLSWTVGEPIIETGSGSTYILTQGFHQSRLTVTAIDPSTFSGVEFNVFPNPTASQVNLVISKGYLRGFQFTLLNSEGKTLLYRRLSNQNEIINLGSYSPGIYLLRIQHPGKPGFQTFSIVKH